MSILALFEWCETSAIGVALSGSSWAFAAIEALHLLGLALIGGAVLIVDLRILGLVLKGQPVSRVAHQAHPWVNRTLPLMIVSGLALVMSEPIKCYYSTPFWIKMATLSCAILFTYTVRKRVAFSFEGWSSPVWRRVVALVSLALWFVVAASGRWIGYS